MSTYSSRHILSSSVISNQDYDALDLVLNHTLRLNSKEVNLGALTDKVQIELSPVEKASVSHIDEATVKGRLDALLAQKEELKAEFYNLLHQLQVPIEERTDDNDKLRSRLQELECERGRIAQLICSTESLLDRVVNGKVEIEDKVLGEFVSSPSPKVILYYRNILPSSQYRVGGLVPVFVHEMFHAWNYFEAESKDRSIMEIDEPMVEFATFHFLSDLEKMYYHSKTLKVISGRASWQKDSISQKKLSVGSTAAYGFADCLLRKVRDADIPLWLETYAARSASLDPKESKVKNLMKELAPFYPAVNEDKVFKSFKGVIFPKAKSKNTSSVSQIDLLKSCLETLGKEEFTNEDVYAFEPIFKTLYPENFTFQAKLRQLLQRLVKTGELVRVRKGLYKKC